MVITEIETRQIRIGAEDWFNGKPIPKGHVPYWEFPLISIRTNENITGYSMGHSPLGQGKANFHLIHDVFYHNLIGKNPLHHEAIWQEICMKNRHLYHLTDTLQAEIDVALWDIKGKRAGLPIAEMLGQYRDRVPTYMTSPPHLLETMEDVVSESEKCLQQGYRGWKVQLSGSPEKNIPKLRKARELVGNDFPLMLDASATLTFEESLKFGSVLDELSYEWFEEPFNDRHILQLKKLASDIKTPVLAAETVNLFELPQYLREGAIDIVRGDVHLKGGITGVTKVLGMCEIMGYEMEIHTAASPLLDVANLHVGCATRLSRFLEAHHPMFRFGLVNDPLAIQQDGCQHVPSAPGLGVTLDWDWLDDHTVNRISGCEY